MMNPDLPSPPFYASRLPGFGSEARRKASSPSLQAGTSFRTSLIHLLLALGNDDEDEDDEAFSFSSYDGLTIMVP